MKQCLTRFPLHDPPKGSAKAPQALNRIMRQLRLGLCHNALRTNSRRSTPHAHSAPHLHTCRATCPQSPHISETLNLSWEASEEVRQCGRELDNWNILAEKAIAGIMSRGSDERQEAEPKPALWPTRRPTAPGMLLVALVSGIAVAELTPTILTHHR